MKWVSSLLATLAVLVHGDFPQRNLRDLPRFLRNHAFRTPRGFLYSLTTSSHPIVNGYTLLAADVLMVLFGRGNHHWTEKDKCGK